MKFNETEWEILKTGIQTLLAKHKSILASHTAQLEIAEEFGPVEAVGFYQNEIKQTQQYIKEIQNVLHRIKA